MYPGAVHLCGQGEYVSKTKRRELRISSNDDNLLIEASGLLGISVSEFLLSKALPDAERLVEKSRVISLRDDAYKKFLEILDAPAHVALNLATQAQEARAIKHVDE